MAAKKHWMLDPGYDRETVAAIKEIAEAICDIPTERAISAIAIALSLRIGREVAVATEPHARKVIASVWRQEFADRLESAVRAELKSHKLAWAG